MTLRPSRIKAKLSRDEPALCTQLHVADPSVFELASLLGFDGIWMDLEHHGYSVETAGQLMRGARVGVADIVARPGKGEFMRMGRLLELGAQAIMYPRCDGPEEAAEVVSWARFAPLGRRGFDGSNADACFACASFHEYVDHANRETLIIIQMEDEAAIAQAEAIAAVPGVDAVMLGPADYSLLSGFPGDLSNPRVTAALEQVAAAAANTGKHWACTVAGVEPAQQALALGAGILFHGADIVLLKNGMQDIQRRFAPLGFSFGAATQADNSLAAGEPTPTGAQSPAAPRPS